MSITAKEFILGAIIAIVVLSISIGEIVTNINDSNNSTRIKRACFSSGQTWYTDKNGFGNCIPKDKIPSQ